MFQHEAVKTDEMEAGRSARVALLAVDEPPASAALSRRGASVKGEELAEKALGRVHDRMVREIEAMALFAMSAGLGIEPEMARLIEASMRPPNGGSERGGRLPATADDGSAVSLDGALTSVANKHESRLAAAEGRAADQFENLYAAHRSLCRLIAPAQPGSLVLIVEDRRKHPVANAFGALPMVRTMLALAVTSLCAMLGFALSSEVNVANMTKGLLMLQGSALLVNEAFLVSAAAVGGTLANLKRLDRFVSACTYDPRHDSSYWTRLVMGLISGVLLSQVIYGAVGGPTTDADADAHPLRAFDQPVLALMGGFSAELVHDILTHFIDVIGRLFGAKRPAAQDAARQVAAKGGA